MLPAGSGHTSYGSEVAIGTLYSTILPVAGSSLPMIPLLKMPYQIVPSGPTVGRRTVQNGSSLYAVNTGYSVHSSVVGLNFATRHWTNCEIQMLPSLSLSSPYGK